jgi:hypothetical protein
MLCMNYIIYHYNSFDERTQKSETIVFDYLW